MTQDTYHSIYQDTWSFNNSTYKIPIEINVANATETNVPQESITNVEKCVMDINSTSSICQIATESKTIVQNM